VDRSKGFLTASPASTQMPSMPTLANKKKVNAPTARPTNAPTVTPFSLREGTHTPPDARAPSPASASREPEQIEHGVVRPARLEEEDDPQREAPQRLEAQQGARDQRHDGFPAACARAYEVHINTSLLRATPS